MQKRGFSASTFVRSFLLSSGKFFHERRIGCWDWVSRYLPTYLLTRKGKKVVGVFQLGYITKYLVRGGGGLSMDSFILFLFVF